jgi:hypothetical protein
MIINFETFTLFSHKFTLSTYFIALYEHLNAYGTQNVLSFIR